MGKKIVVRYYNDFNNLEKYITDQGIELTEVTHLDCQNCNQITSLPELPNLRVLDCNGCRHLTSLPELPDLRVLDCSDCEITDLPMFPKLVSLNCGSHN
jgi:Leucine-rich repeat (LRR) protein